MFKNIIGPIQAWLLVQGKCVGCGTPLEKGDRVNKKDDMQKVVCKCGRVYMYDSGTRKYRRATMNEA